MTSTDVVATSRLEVNGLGIPFVNHSGLGDTVIQQSDDLREVASKLSSWVNNARSATGHSSMFDRGAYTPPDNPYEEMLAARRAVEHDDIVGGVAETTESFAFGGVKWEGRNEDEADVFNQMNRDIDLDRVIRQMWRETYTYSQFVVATVWDYRTYRVRGRTSTGHRKRKEYTVYCPVRMEIIDSTKVVPIGHGPLGSDLLAWCSTNQEVQHWLRARRGEVVDPVMDQFFIGQYEPPPHEAAELSKLGVDVKNLLTMNPGMVWRHTMTRASHERFAPVRLKSVFKLLDLKQQLVNADRSMLIGAANYILLVRKGDENMPAKPEEMRNLKENFNFIAKLPVVISDHRLEIDIIAPKTDFTLQQDRYDLIDTRIMTRLLGTLSLGGRGQRNETNVTLSRAVGRNMENRRHMIARDIERNVARAVYFHPRNRGVFEEGDEPSLVFVPRNIALDIDAAIIQAMMNLRQSKEISRETILEYFGLDQGTEAQRREMEAELYDDVFQTIVPHGGINENAPQEGEGDEGKGGTPAQSGRNGGRPQGGGDGKESRKVKPKSANGNPSTGSGEE